MKYPAFFDEVPAITLYDPLADLLGAIEEGMVTYTYLDAVKLAGHSCPTVAGAYLMALKGLDALYPDSVPQRGDIVVTIRGGREEGTNGVVGNVLGLITGAAAEEGFKGLGGHFSRNALLRFERALSAPVMMQRKETGEAVYLHYNPSAAPIAPIPPERMRAVTSASEEEKKAFGRLWQQNVAAILADRSNPDVIALHKKC